MTFADTWQGQTGVARTPREALAIVGFSETGIEVLLKAFEDEQEAKRQIEADRLARKTARAAKKR